MTLYCDKCEGVKCTTESKNEGDPIPIFCTPDDGELRKPNWRKGQFHYAGTF